MLPDPRVIAANRRRITRQGLVFKIFFVVIVILTISSITTSALFIGIGESVDISRDIVKVRYEIMSISQRLVDNLLSMEENQKKYEVLKQEEYKGYFMAALKEYRNAIWSILWFRHEGANVWQELHDEFKKEFPDLGEGRELAKEPWIPQDRLNVWMRMIVEARRENERIIEAGMRELYGLSEASVSRGVKGLFVSVAVGLLGIVYLAYSLNRPLRELRRGIRAFIRDGRLEPIRILSRDELGELGAAFNEMTMRLKEEEKMRTDFIDMISHEIRTPLTSIRESVNLIRERVMGDINDRQKRFLDIAGAELERITNLLTRLMRVSSMASRMVDVVFSPVNPEELVAATLEKAAPAAEAKGIELATRLAPGLPMTLGDPELMGQALLNLVGNAVKFSPEGSTVTVAAELADGNRRLLFSISDQGPGISVRDQPFVFNKYYRGASTKATTDGIGLGLNISRSIVEAHGGDIWLSSLPGKGCTFYFTIPIDRERD